MVVLGWVVLGFCLAGGCGLGRWFWFWLRRGWGLVLFCVCFEIGLRRGAFEGVCFGVASGRFFCEIFFDE